MGVLLLPSKKKKVMPNPVFDSLQIVYTPSTGSEGSSSDDMKFADPSGIKVSFKPASVFEVEERQTR